MAAEADAPGTHAAEDEAMWAAWCEAYEAEEDDVTGADDTDDDPTDVVVIVDGGPRGRCSPRRCGSVSGRASPAAK